MGILDKVTETMMAAAMLLFMGIAVIVVIAATVFLITINGILIHAEGIRKELKWPAKKE